MARAQRKEEILKSELPPTLPLMALRSTIVYPLGTIAVQMGAPENLSLIRSHDEAGLIVALVVAGGDHDEAIDPSAFLGRVGVAARVHERINLPGDTVQITLQGLRRIIIEGVEQRDPYPVARIRPAPETPLDPVHGEELMARLVNAAETLAELVDRIPDEVPAILKMNMSDPGRFADLAATNMNFRIADKDEVLQRLDIGERIRFMLTRLEREVARARVMEDVKRQTEVKIEQHQREFYLRQQLRAIQAELGETDPGEKEAVDLLKKIEEANLPEKVMQEARRETERMRMLSPASSEYQVIRTYLDWIIALPWNKKSGTEQIELKKVEEALDVAALRARRGEGAHHRVPRGAQAARRRARTARSSASSDLRAPARPRSARRSRSRSGASSIASPLAACATKRRFAGTVARTSARCRGSCSRRSGAWA